MGKEIDLIKDLLYSSFMLVVMLYRNLNEGGLIDYWRETEMNKVFHENFNKINQNMKYIL